jgi:hypothetical protein
VGSPDRRYQLAFLIPGIFPSSANFLSMIRDTRNFRYTPRARPVNWHRRTVRVLNFGFRKDLAICALVVICVLHPYFWSAFRNGIPNCSSTNRLFSGLEFENTKLMCIPCVNVTSAMLISGNTPCSVSPIE